MINKELFIKMTPLAKFAKATGCMRVYRNGDTLGFLFRKWHPVSWPIWLIALIVCGWNGGSSVNEEIRFRLNDYWQEREKQGEIEWL